MTTARMARVQELIAEMDADTAARETNAYRALEAELRKTQKLLDIERAKSADLRKTLRDIVAGGAA